MLRGYYLSGADARLARAAAVLFLLASALQLGSVVAASSAPGSTVGCKPRGCYLIQRPTELLPEAERPAVRADRASQRRYDSYVARGPVRLGLAGVALVGGLPLALLLCFVGLGLRRLADRKDDGLARGLPWFRRAGLAAVATAIAGPLAASLSAMLLLPGTPSGPGWYVAVDVNALLVNLLLALAAFSVTAALEAGSRAASDAAGFV